MNPNDHILNLVTETIVAIETNNFLLSTIIRKCIRISRLRNDYLNLWWLEWEMVNIINKNERLKIFREILSHFPKESYEYFKKNFYEEWVKEREIVTIDSEGKINSGDSIIAKGVGEIELDYRNFHEIVNDSQTPSGLHPLDLYFVDQSRSNQRIIARTMASSFQAVLERIKQRAHDFLSQSEKQLIYGQLHADIFEQNRQYVDLKLGQLCPEALMKFIEAYQRLKDNTPESRAQATTSCRRLLKSLADQLYPPSNNQITGVDGKIRVLDKEKYISRLWQYVFERIGRSASGELLFVQVQDLGNRIDRLYDLTNKGVHDEVSEFEVNQCVIQTYLLIGDLIRISENQSAILKDLEP